MIINRVDVVKNIETWAYKTFGTKFEFRQHQEEACIDIVYNFLTGNRNYILQAPTGSGKSIIAMIVAGVLSEFYGKTGYILISDLSLVSQYERDIERYKPEWGVIRGQSNYMCLENSFTYNMGECKIPYKKSLHDNSVCKEYCPYLKAFSKAVSSDVTVSTYQHWLVHQNMVNDDNKYIFDNSNIERFEERDFVICDEAHKLVDIIQSHYSITFGGREESYIMTLTDTFNNVDVLILDRLRDISDRMKSIGTDGDASAMYSAISEFNTCVGSLYNSVRGVSIDKSKDGSKVREIVNALNWIREYAERIDVYVNNLGNYNDIVYSQSENGFILNSIGEKGLLDKYFHTHYKNCLYMSATIGEVNQFAYNANIPKYEYKSIPSTFDFKNSPIYYIPGYKMSYAYKDRNFPIVCEMIDDILNIYKDFRGCILVSSYDMALYVKEHVSRKNAERIFTYESSRDKENAMSDFLYSDNGVLIGPSLFDGISLDDDMCRFLIISKIPYPDLKNNFVKRKMELSETWYNNQAVLSIIQGIGRGIRNNKDWCVSFVLDGSFVNLANRYSDLFDDTIKNNGRVIQLSRNQLKI